MEQLIHPGQLSGTAIIPPSKSDAQRTYLSAALAQGKSVITGWGNSDDERAMRKAIQELGAKVSTGDKNELIIDGLKSFPSTATISPGESGLGIRLLTPVCAAFPAQVTIKAEGSLLTRPMDFFETNFPKFDAVCHTTNGNPPLRTEGPLMGAEATVDGSQSSQFISGLLMALPLVKGDSVLNVSDLKSGAYVDMTLQTLESFGIAIDRQDSVFSIKGEQNYKATNYHIDADWSSASYWLVAAALGHPIVIEGLRMNSLQADKALLGFLLAANCKITHDGNQIRVDGSNRQLFTGDATDCPDLFPALATLAAYCKGVTRIKGVLRLEHKESHRGLTLQSEFGKLGVRIDLEGDEMIIHGTGKVNGGTISSHHDHRIAMCLGVAATLAEGPILVTGSEAVSKSYPDFWKDLEGLLKAK